MPLCAEASGTAHARPGRKSVFTLQLLIPKVEVRSPLEGHLPEEF